MFEAMHYLLPIVFLFIAQDIRATKYVCDYRTNSCGCSRQPAIIAKIFGSESAQQNTWSWVVSLRNSEGHFCGGSILNEWYIITAAHCFIDRMHILPNLTACAGTNHLSDACHQRRSLQSVTNHPAYTNRTFENDIALIRVSKSFDLTDTSITRICLPDPSHNNEYPQASTNVTAVGWGRTEISSQSDALLQVTLQVVDKSASACNDIVYNHRLQLCAAAPGKDTCQGDSGGPLMVFTTLKRWELVGITSYGRGCAKAHPGVYTSVTAFLTFIQSIINNMPPRSTTNTCSCQCPHGFDQGVAYTTEHSAQACVAACRAVPSNPCISSNTYACLGTNCVYSNSYNHPTTTSPTKYTCSCQCPRGSDQGVAYTTEYSAQACVTACRAVSSNPCISSNTYACLGTNCAYSNSYNHPTTTSPTKYTCSCQCPRGSNQGVAYTTEYSAQACVAACRAVSSNSCYHTNTYACLGTNCAYSNSYNHPITTSPTQYTCSCQCPRGSDQGVAYTTEYSGQACVAACRAVSSNRCVSSNTYACLGTDCAYSDSYNNPTTTLATRYTCSCQCPHGFDQGVAYTTEYSAQACVAACRAVSSNPCVSSNTYACLGTDCAYSNSYNHPTTTSPTQYTCSCQCPRGSDQGVAYTTEYSAQACVSACRAVSSNPCISSNTYACLGTNCAYSNSYNHPTTTLPTQYTCSCQCPYGSDQGVAYTTEYSAQACVRACEAFLPHTCNFGNTYACLGSNCAYAFMQYYFP